MRLFLYNFCVSWFFNHFGGIYVMSGHFWVVMKKVKFYSIVPHDIQRSLVQVIIFFEVFLHCLCVFLDNLTILSVYVIFAHFGAIIKSSKLLFHYSSRYSKVIVQVKKIEVFFVFLMCVSWIIDYFCVFTQCSSIIR